METFKDFHCQRSGKNAQLNYTVGLSTYAEGLSEGTFFAYGWNGSGYPVRPGMMLSHTAIRNSEMQQAFILEMDGQSLISHWRLVDTAKSEDGNALIVRITLEHEKRPVRVVVCTKLDGSGCMSRWLEITNTGSAPATISRLAPLSGMLERTKNWRKMLREPADSPYRLGYFENSDHMHEGQFRWHSLHSDSYTFGGRYARMRYRHPFFLLENHSKGTAYAVQMAYSGGYAFTFDFSPDPVDGHLMFACDIDGFKPIRVVQPNETVTSPEVLISMVNGNYDDAIYAMHTHIRRAVMRPPHGEGCYTETAGGGDIVSMKASVDRAVRNGFDIFYIDAGWYFPQGMDALGCTGTWEPDPVRFPNGIRELTDYCHEKGIRFGLWMEPERVGSLCSLAEAHKDKYLRKLDDSTGCGYPQGGKGGCYDLSRKEVADYVEDQIVKMIEMSGIDMFRLDFNTVYIAPWSYHEESGFMESADFRYCENFSAMFNRIRERFPNVIFENCASGGGRTDLGAVKYFDHTWVTDNPIAPRCFAITNGMTMCLPPELIDRLVTSMGTPEMASLQFGLFQLMFVRPTSHFPGSDDNPLQIGPFRQFMQLYNSFARPMLPTCRIYHHTPSFDDCEPKGLGILEAVSEEKDKAMLGIFVLSDPGISETTVRFRGISATGNYRVTAVDAGETFTVSGYDLKYKGLTYGIRAPLTAELFLAERI